MACWIHACTWECSCWIHASCGHVHGCVFVVVGRLQFLSNIVSKCYSQTDPSVVDFNETNITFPLSIIFRRMSVQCCGDAI